MMKLMKVGLALIAIMGLIISLTACENNSESSNNNDYTEIKESMTDDVVESETENSELALECDAILASGYDKDSNLFELVGNQDEDYENVKTEIGVVKNGEWSVQMKQTDDYNINLSEDTLNECEDFYYIGSGCFYYNEGIFINGYNGKSFKTKKHVILGEFGDRIEALDAGNGGMTQALSEEAFKTDEGKVLLYEEYDKFSLLDVNEMKENDIALSLDFHDDSWNRETHSFTIFPYSEGLIGIIEPNETNYEEVPRNGFYDVNGKCVIDLNKYNIVGHDGSISQEPLAFKEGECSFITSNTKGTNYKITIDKKGKVIESNKIEEDYEDEEEY